MLVVSGVLRFTEVDVPMVRDEVIGILEKSRRDAGCVEYWWAADLEDPGAFRFFECWESQEAFEAHRNQPFEGAFAERVLPRLIGVEAYHYDVDGRRPATG